MVVELEKRCIDLWSTLDINAHGRHIKRARLNKEPPTNFKISLHKVKSQSIISEFYLTQGIPYTLQNMIYWPLTLCRLILKCFGSSLFNRAHCVSPTTRGHQEQPRAVHCGGRQRRVTLLGHRTHIISLWLHQEVQNQTSRLTYLRKTFCPQRI